jgi:hypothetical protein
MSYVHEWLLRTDFDQVDVRGTGIRIIAEQYVESSNERVAAAAQRVITRIRRVRFADRNLQRPVRG